MPTTVNLVDALAAGAPERHAAMWAKLDDLARKLRKPLSDEELAGLLSAQSGRASVPLLVSLLDCDRITADQARARIIRHWQKPGTAASLWGVPRLVDALRRLGYLSDGPEQPAAPLTLYRGQTAGAPPGMSWSTDREQAATFAAHDINALLGAKRAILAAEAVPSAVLARFRWQSEALVDPDGLEDVRAV